MNKPFLGKHHTEEHKKYMRELARERQRFGAIKHKNRRTPKVIVIDENGNETEVCQEKVDE